MAKVNGKVKAKAPKAPRAPRQKQGYLSEDMEPPHIPAIDSAATDYAAARDARMRLGEDEQQRAKELLDLMHEHGLKRYEHEGRVVTVEAPEKVRVRKAPKVEVE